MIFFAFHTVVLIFINFFFLLFRFSLFFISFILRSSSMTSFHSCMNSVKSSRLLGLCEPKCANACWNSVTGALPSWVCVMLLA